MNHRGSQVRNSATMVVHQQALQPTFRKAHHHTTHTSLKSKPCIPSELAGTFTPQLAGVDQSDEASHGPALISGMAKIPLICNPSQNISNPIVDRLRVCKSLVTTAALTGQGSMWPPAAHSCNTRITASMPHRLPATIMPELADLIAVQRWRKAGACGRSAQVVQEGAIMYPVQRHATVLCGGGVGMMYYRFMCCWKSEDVSP